MKDILKCLITSVIVWSGVLHAESPYAPDFSLKTHVLQEPPALMQNYNTGLPESWEYYATKAPRQNVLIPTMPVIMEICAIMETPLQVYLTKESLMQGCRMGDKGLLHLILQPYQYLPSLHTLENTSLIANTGQTYNYPQIVIYYKIDEKTQDILTSIELGDFYDENGSIIVNGESFWYNKDVMLTFHKLIREISDEVIY
ncbi:hypothetical protein [Helicobacter trogontum]|uniref:Uncharacterized protein n=1 Tax=Helicobacter trogontum TaxID=50960 RepID=A0A4V6I329_9HELI|nr:hypothetical protein [Helicobacter trogontum]MCI5787326.1 hypothetical protein [Helicobacter trogontum]MDY5186044.1 hypothetical protein [Helicobacter trogontum]TLD83621.1 hypothetical protein LS81_004380 [Helicobacter trogontum]TLD98352.1 hypothetical protein LS80_004905 [Helicobacter trogontum]